MNQAFSKIWIVVAIVILLAGGILAWQYFGAPKEVKAPEEVVEDETANWKTYRNEEYKYEVKYPSNWQNFGELWGGFNITSPTIEGRADNRIIVMVAPEREGVKTNQEYIDDMIRGNTIPGYNELNRKKEIIINEINGYEIVWNMLDSETRQLEEGPLNIYLETPSTNKAHFIILIFQGKGSQYETNLHTFNQMLSTFRFSPH